MNEAISNLHRVLKDLIEDYVEKGWEIPEPGREPESFSGNFMVRTTSELHGRLVEKARKEGVSLNYLVGLLLERSLTERNVIDDLIGKSREARSHILKVLPGEKRKAAGSKK